MDGREADEGGEGGRGLYSNDNIRKAASYFERVEMGRAGTASLPASSMAKRTVNDSYNRIRR